MHQRILCRGVCSAVLTLALAALRCQAIEQIDVSVAPLYVGKDVIVEGPISSTERQANIVRLQMGPASHGLVVSLVIPMLNDFPPKPETYYAGKTIRAAGYLGSYHGTPELAVRAAQDISVVGEPAQGSANGTTPDEAALRQRVRELEQRVQDLEQGKSAPPKP